MLLVSEEGFRIVAHDDLFLKGECKRCGQCCEKRKCPHLKFETLDGTKQASCSIYRERPVGCALWPMKDDKLPEDCGFWWEKL